MQHLFATKPSWTLGELLPYVESALERGGSAEKFVLQFARCVTAPDGSRSYVRR